MDGLQLTVAIAADPSLGGVPLVMLSSGGQTGLAAAARAAGIAAYLAKPVRPAAARGPRPAPSINLRNRPSPPAPRSRPALPAETPAAPGGAFSSPRTIG